jgi:threonine synthase
MTTVLDKNVHNLAVKGTFDDCQDIVKALFGDADTNKSLNLGAVNSINWARILAQIVYYFNSYFQLVKTSSLKVGEPVRFVVPTGNFGNILAGYFAKRMGLPIEKLVGK